MRALNLELVDAVRENAGKESEAGDSSHFEKVEFASFYHLPLGERGIER
jgi:hypothetical protein